MALVPFGSSSPQTADPQQQMIGQMVGYMHDVASRESHLTAADLEVRCVQWVRQQLGSNTAELQQFQQQNIAAAMQQFQQQQQASVSLATAQISQQLAAVDQRQSSALRVGLLNTATGAIANTSAATNHIYDVLSQEVAQVQNLVVDVRATVESVLQTQAIDAGTLQVVTADVRLCVDELRRHVGIIQNLEAQLKQLAPGSKVQSLGTELAALRTLVTAFQQDKRFDELSAEILSMSEDLIDARANFENLARAMEGRAEARAQKATASLQLLSAEVSRAAPRTSLARVEATLGATRDDLRVTASNLTALENTTASTYTRVATRVDDVAEGLSQHMAKNHASVRYVDDKLDDMTQQIVRLQQQLRDTKSGSTTDAAIATLTAKLNSLESLMARRRDDDDDTPPRQNPELHLRSSGTDVEGAILKLVDALHPKPETVEVDPTIFSAIHHETWPAFLTDHGPVLFAIAMKESILGSSPSAQAKNDFQALMDFCTAYFAQDYEWPFTKANEKYVQNLLRKARISAANVNQQSVDQLLTKTDFKGDPVGAAIASATKKATSTDKTKPKKKVTCWYCLKVGHSAHTCQARLAAGAPVPTAPRTPAQVTGDPATVSKRTKTQNKHPGGGNASE